MILGGQHTPFSGGQYAPFLGGQLKPFSGGQHERYFQSHHKDNLVVFENSNGVIFSNNFRILFRNGLDFDDYKLLKVDDFYIEEQYQDRYPETYGAVIVAENGSGDSLGLILKKNSDYELDDILVEFLHETGEIDKRSNINPTLNIGNGDGICNSTTSGFKKLINKLKGK